MTSVPDVAVIGVCGLAEYPVVCMTCVPYLWLSLSFGGDADWMAVVPNTAPRLAVPLGPDDVEMTCVPYDLFVDGSDDDDDAADDDGWIICVPLPADRFSASSLLLATTTLPTLSNGGDDDDDDEKPGSCWMTRVPPPAPGAFPFIAPVPSSPWMTLVPRLSYFANSSMV